MIYLDNAATTVQIEAVTNEMIKYMTGDFGNPSSLHTMGLTAEKAINEARRTCANALNSLEEEMFFTQNGTISNNIAILGIANANQRKSKKIITTSVEHPAVLETFKHLKLAGYEVTFLGVDKYGLVDLEQLNSIVNESVSFVSIMHVNNEVGTIMPLKRIGDILKKHNIIFHSDMTQSFGKFEIDVRYLGIDVASASAHKIHGPKGNGVLYLKKGVKHSKLIFGGGQEKGIAPGTENVAGIVGLSAAVKAATENIISNRKYVLSLKEYMINALKSEIADIKFNGFTDENTSPYILNVSFLRTKGEVLLHMLETENIYVSTSSACSSNKNGKSHVLTAMGLTNDEIEGAIRFSFSKYNKKEEIDFTVEKLKNAVKSLRKIKM